MFFFFNDTATTEIYALSLHDALRISHSGPLPTSHAPAKRSGPSATATDSPTSRDPFTGTVLSLSARGDRKSTRLNSSHVRISYAVFFLKKNTTSGYAPSSLISVYTIA